VLKSVDPSESAIITAQRPPTPATYFIALRITPSRGRFSRYGRYRRRLYQGWTMQPRRRRRLNGTTSNRNISTSVALTLSRFDSLRTAS
jgi:hypothetical protein